MTSVIFTDLDGTLLDHHTYSWEAARPALEELARRGVPWIPVTSKTRAELEVLRAELGHTHPFIVENGAAAFIPHGYFPFSIPGTVRRDGYEVVEWGRPYAYLRQALRRAAQHSGCEVTGFGDMTDAEVAEACGLPLESARLARQREYDEPFLIREAGKASRLVDELRREAVHWTRGGRFWHICGPADKGVAVKELCRWYGHHLGPIRSIGLGDSLNDLSFLRVVDVPVLMATAQAGVLRKDVPGVRIARLPGPAGWSAEVLELIGAG